MILFQIHKGLHVSVLLEVYRPVPWAFTSMSLSPIIHTHTIICLEWYKRLDTWENCPAKYIGKQLSNYIHLVTFWAGIIAGTGRRPPLPDTSVIAFGIRMPCRLLCVNSRSNCSASSVGRSVESIRSVRGPPARVGPRQKDRLHLPSSKFMKSWRSSRWPDRKFCSRSMMWARSPIWCPMAIFLTPLRESCTVFFVSRMPPGPVFVELVAW